MKGSEKGEGCCTYPTPTSSSLLDMEGITDILLYRDEVFVAVTTQYFTVLDCKILYCNVLYCTLFYCTVLNYIVS